MTRHLETKACRSCAAAKRRCGKQIPCLRCRTRGLECTYPPTKPSSFVLYREDTPIAESITDTGTNTDITLHSASPSSIGTYVRDTSLSLGLGPEFTSFSNPLLYDQSPSSWFASTETWQVRSVTASQDLLDPADFKYFALKVIQWLAEWTEKGSNNFIHASLYRTRFPRCIQDAYTTLTCYFQRSPMNEQIIYRIIEDRINSLISDHIDSPSKSSGKTEKSAQLDPLEHIARVHALLVYLIIGLFDGDIRLRHLSETQMPILNIWTREMIHHVSVSPCLGSYLTLSAHEQALASSGSACTAERSNILWHSWILAESARRAWVLGSGVQATFIALQQKSVTPCQGGMMITTRKGVWEAPSAVTWEKLCVEVHVGLMQVAEADKLFEYYTPSEVNDFAKLVLEVGFGRDKMERWGVQYDD